MVSSPNAASPEPCCPASWCKLAPETVRPPNFVEEGAAGEDGVVMNQIDPQDVPQSPRPTWATDGIPYGDDLLRSGTLPDAEPVDINNDDDEPVDEETLRPILYAL